MYADHGRIWNRPVNMDDPLRLCGSLPVDVRTTVTACSISESGKYLVIGGSCGNVWIYYCQQNRYSRLSNPVVSTKAVISSVCFREMHTGDSSKVSLVLAQTDRMNRQSIISVTDVMTLSVVAATVASNRGLSGIEFMKCTNGNLLVTGSSESVTIWEIQDSSLLKMHVYQRDGLSITQVDVDVTGDTVVVYSNGEVELNGGAYMCCPKLPTNAIPVSVFKSGDSIVLGYQYGGDFVVNVSGRHFGLKRTKVIQAALIGPSMLVILTEDGVTEFINIGVDSLDQFASTEFLTGQMRLDGIVSGFAVSQEFLLVHDAGRKFALIFLPAILKNTSVDSTIVPISLSNENRIQTYVNYFQLPMNESAFNFLISDGDTYQEYYSQWEEVLLRQDDDTLCVVKSEKAVVNLLECLALISLWDETLLGNTRVRDFLPGLVFPFVRLFWSKSPHFTFELIVVFVANFGRHWFGDEVIDMGDVSRLDPQTVFQTCTSLLTDIWSRECWLQLIDEIGFYYRNSCRNQVPDFLVERVLVEYMDSRRIFPTTLHADVTPKDVSHFFSKAVSCNRAFPQQSSSKPYILSESSTSYPPAWRRA